MFSLVRAGREDKAALPMDLNGNATVLVKFQSTKLSLHPVMCLAERIVQAKRDETGRDSTFCPKAPAIHGRNQCINLGRTAVLERS